ncbi:enoyl-CoA hydratase/isomerase family protein [Flavobacteriales bacterium]|nr:enoyl-CoA hydratase/isomerase family protein [Flavobacteriales bacterium]
MLDAGLTEGVSLTVDDRGVAYLTFAHPRSNSLPGAVLTELAAEVRALGLRSDVKVVVVGSAGDRAFCAGASFDELVAISDEEAGLSFFMGFAHVINALRSIPQFVIGRIQGKAVGGGVGVAAATDYCLATRHAAVKLSELAIGIGPFVVGPAVERKLGVSSMSQLAMDAASWRSAEWACERGLYAEVLDDTEALDAAVETLAGRLAHSNPEAMSALKKNFWSGTEHWDTLLPERAAVSGRLVLSDFTREAIARFKAG